MRRGSPRLRLAGALAGSLLLLAASAPAAEPPHPLAGWAAVVIAGDWRAGPGRSTKAFDNGRRDLARALTAAGFAPSNVLQYSLRPSWPGDDPDVVTSDSRVAVRAFIDKAKTARSGCLFYVTSHGLPDGAIFGPKVLMTPDMLRRLMADACPARPSVVVVSACFSGVFLPALAAPDRLVMTASRRDRSSFGCGAESVRTYFDDCVLKAMAGAAGFLSLPPAVKACVAAREKAEGMSPPSEPQSYVGPAFAKASDAFAFARPAISAAGSSPRSARARPAAAPPADAPPARRRGTHSP